MAPTTGQAARRRGRAEPRAATSRRASWLQGPGVDATGAGRFTRGQHRVELPGPPRVYAVRVPVRRRILALAARVDCLEGLRAPVDDHAPTGPVRGWKTAGRERCVAVT